MLGIFNKTKKRKQSCLLLTEDGRILEIAPTVLRGYVTEHKTQEAWELYPDERIPKKGTNRLFQVIAERDMAPLSLDGANSKQREKRVKKTLSQIAQESAAIARANLQKQSLKNKQAETIQLLIIILGITVGLLVLVSLFLSGKLGGGGGGGGSIFSALPGVFGFLGLKKGKASENKAQNGLNTLVLDPRKGYGLEHVDAPRGNQWSYKRKPVFLMKRTYNNGDSEEGILEVFELPKDLGDSPGKLYRGLVYWDKIVPIIFSLQNPIWEKLKIVAMYVLSGILLLVIYLIWSSIMG
jgi:hypothetical protein